MITKAIDLARPGHIFPIVGMMAVQGEQDILASIDLSLLAGLKPSGVICEIMADDGSMARGKELENFPENIN